MPTPRARCSTKAGKFAADVLAPINGAGDLEGCRCRGRRGAHAGRLSRGLAAFVEGGWAALSAAPRTTAARACRLLLDAAFDEMIAAANHGWTMAPGLLHGAYECLEPMAARS